MTYYCSNCGKPVNGKFCTNCGGLVKNYAESIPKTGSEFDSVNAINTNKKGRKKGGCLKFSLISILVLFVIGMIGFISSQNEESTAPTNTNQQTEFQKITDTTPEQETEILVILNNCGIIKVQSIEADEALNDMNEDGEKGYRISANGINNIILYLKPDKTVNMIRYADSNLYSNGTVNSKLSDYTFTLDEQTKLQTSCQEAVKSVLKSPSTAKFPNITKWTFGKKDGEIIIQSYVDSQNAFGAELRSEFRFILSDGDYTVKSFIFEGKEYIKK